MDRRDRSAGERAVSQRDPGPVPRVSGAVFIRRLADGGMGDFAGIVFFGLDRRVSHAALGLARLAVADLRGLDRHDRQA